LETKDDNGNYMPPFQFVGSKKGLETDIIGALDIENEAASTASLICIGASIKC